LAGRLEEHAEGNFDPAARVPDRRLFLYEVELCPQ